MDPFILSTLAACDPAAPLGPSGKPSENAAAAEVIFGKVDVGEGIRLPVPAIWSAPERTKPDELVVKGPDGELTIWEIPGAKVVDYERLDALVTDMQRTSSNVTGELITIAERTSIGVSADRDGAHTVHLHIPVDEKTDVLAVYHVAATLREPLQGALAAVTSDREALDRARHASQLRGGALSISPLPVPEHFERLDAGGSRVPVSGTRRGPIVEAEAAGAFMALAPNDGMVSMVALWLHGPITEALVDQYVADYAKQNAHAVVKERVSCACASATRPPRASRPSRSRRAAHRARCTTSSATPSSATGSSSTTSKKRTPTAGSRRWPPTKAHSESRR
jgi:hypothetical protein